MVSVKPEQKVEIVNTIKAHVGFVVPNSNIRKTFRGKGARTKMPFEDLEQAFYEPGVSYLFETGILYIGDMEVKKALGLENEGADVPERVIVLEDEEMDELLTEGSFKDFLDTLSKLSPEQAKSLAERAVEIEITNMTKAQDLKEATGIDVLTRIQEKQSEASE